MPQDLILDDPRMIVLAAAVALVAGLVRGYSGIGGPAIMVLVLTQFFSPLSVLTKVAIIDALSYLLLVPGTFRHFNRRVIAMVTIPTLVGIPVGTYLLMVTDPEVMKRAIAAAVALCVVVMMLGSRFRASPSIAVHVAVGLLAGVVLGATLIALVVMVFFFALPVSGTESRANAVFWGIILANTLVGVHIVLGNITVDDLWRTSVLGAFYLAGTGAGAWWFRKTGERGFRQFVLWLLLGLAAIGLVA